MTGTGPKYQEDYRLDQSNVQNGKFPSILPKPKRCENFVRIFGPGILTHWARIRLDRPELQDRSIFLTNFQKSVCLGIRIFSNFDLKFGREVDLDELNNVIKGTFSKSPLSTDCELFSLENRLKIGIFWVWQLITFESLDDTEKIFNLTFPQHFFIHLQNFVQISSDPEEEICSNH